MTIDDVARRAGHDLRQATAADVEAALRDLQRAMPRRRRAHAVAATCAVVLALVVGAGTTRWLLPDAPRVVAPVGPPTVSDASTPAVSDECTVPLITCLGERRYKVSLLVPMEWTLAEGFGTPYSGAPPQPNLIETYDTAGNGGFTVLEDVQAPRNQADPAAVPDITTAEALARWIARRPFLSASPVREGTVDGRRAWTVDVRMRPGLPDGPEVCSNRFACYPVLLQGTHVIGAWGNMLSRYTVLDLPGAGVSVLWAWDLDGAAIPEGVDDIVRSIRFG